MMGVLTIVCKQSVVFGGLEFTHSFWDLGLLAIGIWAGPPLDIVVAMSL
jgi:hypothetical protein